MNDKKINELAEEAGFVFWKDEKWGPGPGHIDWSSGYDEEFLKYTELIVQECVEVILKTDVSYIETDAMHRIRDRVKEHFGVEE